MRVVIASLLFMLGYIWRPSNASTITSNCKEWSCQDGIGSGSGANRMCAQIFGDTTFGVEKCQPDKWLCDANYTLTQNVTCGDFTILPWKDDMPAGDSCNYDDECFTDSCNSTAGDTRTCSGKNESSSCGDDRECYPGLYCNSSNVCGKVSTLGEACNANIRCEFGSHCINETCKRFGTQKDGTQFYIQDAILFPNPSELQNKMFWTCENFYAYNTGKKNGNYPILECGEGPVANFTSYKRKVNDQAECYFALPFNNGTTGNLTEYATCGYNHNSNHYCPKRRGGDEWESLTNADRKTWEGLGDLQCHHRSTIQYCRGIEDNELISAAFRLFMQNEWETTGEGYPMIAKGDRCSGNEIVTTRGYYRLIDSAQGMTMTYFMLVAAFLGLVLLN